MFIMHVYVFLSVFVQILRIFLYLIRIWGRKNIRLIKNDFFHQHMVDFVNKIEFSDNKYQTNGTVRDEKYKGKLLLTMI